MKINIFTLLILLSICQNLLADSLSLTHNPNNCPNFEQTVTFLRDDANQYIGLRRRWTVEHGELKNLNSSLTEDINYDDFVKVYWDANQSTGKITLEILYEGPNNLVKKKVEASVSIRSIGGVIPKFSNKTSEELPCGSSIVSISLQDMSYADTQFGKISKFEWKLPEGLSYNSSIGTVIGGKNISLTVAANFPGDTITVRGCSDCENLYSNEAQYTITRNVNATSLLCNILSSTSPTSLPYKNTRSDIVSFAESCIYPAINNTNYLPVKLYNNLQCTQSSTSDIGSSSVRFYKKFAIPNSTNSLVAVYVRGNDKRSTIMLCIVSPSGDILHTIDAAVNLDGVVLKQFEITADNKIVIYTINPTSTTSISYSSNWTTFYGMRTDETFIIENGSKFKQVKRMEYYANSYRKNGTTTAMQNDYISVSSVNGTPGRVPNEIWRRQEMLMVIYCNGNSDAEKIENCK